MLIHLMRCLVVALIGLFAACDYFPAHLVNEPDAGPNGDASRLDALDQALDLPLVDGTLDAPRDGHSTSDLDAQVTDGMPDSLDALPAVDAGPCSWTGPVASNTTVTLRNIWGTAATEIWAVGNGSTVLASDGASWGSISPGGSPTPTLHGVWSSSLSDVWTVGVSGTAWHYDGSVWIKGSTPTNKVLFGVWGSSSSDIWAVGESGIIYHSSGGAWSDETSPVKNTLRAVWGSGPSNVWAVGGSSTMALYNGSSWSQISVGSVGGLYAIHGRSGSDLWAVGDKSTGGIDYAVALHFQGTFWIVDSPSPAMVGQLRAVWVSPSGQVWAGGYDPSGGLILRHDGVSWSKVSPPNIEQIHGIWGTGDCDVWAVGANGSIYHLEPASP